MIVYIKYIKAGFMLKMSSVFLPGLVTDAATSAEKGNAKAGVRHL